MYMRSLFRKTKSFTMIALSISTILCGCTTAKDADNHVTQEQTINYTYNHDLYEKSVSNSEFCIFMI